MGVKPMAQVKADASRPLAQITWLFLKLGTTAFGGPAGHIAMMEEEVVRRRQWLTHEEFLDLLGATNLIPGPNSTELALHIGHRRAGWAGLIVAGSCFILPAALIVGIIAWAYVRFGKLPQVEGLLYGIKPVIIAVVLQALWTLARTAVKTRWLAVIGLTGAVLNFLGVNELIILFGTGLLVTLGRELMQRRNAAVVCGFPFLGVIPGVSLLASGGAAAPFSLWTMWLFFLKVGAVLFGSGYVLLAFLRADLVERWHWLNESQLMDAIAVGQFTPGPVFTTATFIGYVLGGTTGAVIATVGIFLPAFLFVAVSGPLVPRLRRSPVASAFLDGVNVASLALMAVVTWQLGATSLVDWPSACLAVIAAFLLLRYQLNSAWLVLGGAGAGWLLAQLRGG
jgi:chromate transporter